MSTIVKPFTFSAGATIIAAEHNSNFDTIYSDYNGGITNANINASAAIAYSKLTLTGSIVNADINASAAIVDTKLASISTAGKVSGAALTSLSSIPSGAGRVPTANLGGGGATSSTFLRGDSTWASPSVASVQIFTANGNFTAPPGITKVYLTMIGGGGGGAGGTAGDNGGGTAGGLVLDFPYTVIPGNSYAIVVGAGGSGGASSGGNGNPGNASTFDAAVTALAGVQGVQAPSAGAVAPGGFDASVATVGTINFKMGNGGDPGGAGGGAGGSSIFGLGGVGKAPAAGTGTAASANTGAGGGGAGSSGGDATGGAGGSGLVIVEF